MAAPARGAGKNTQAIKHVRFASFPRYLLVQMRRYYVDQSWTPKKMEVLVDVPEHLSLQSFRAKGVQVGARACRGIGLRDRQASNRQVTGFVCLMQPGEELQPEEEASSDAATAAAAVQADGGIVSQLVAMGFSENGSKRAAVATKNAGTVRRCTLVCRCLRPTAPAAR